MSFLQLLFSFNGRIGRKLFWLGVITPICLMLALLYQIEDRYSIDGLIQISGYILIIWIGTAGFSKRLHDLNKSGWLQLYFLIPAGATWALSIIFHNPKWIILLGYCVFLIGLWISIKAGITQGTYGPNRFSTDATHSIRLDRWTNEPNEKDNKEEDIKSANTNHNSSLRGSTTTNKRDKDGVLDDWLNKVEPEILRTTNTVFNNNGIGSENKIANQIDQSSPTKDLAKTNTLTGNSQSSEIEKKLTYENDLPLADNNRSTSDERLSIKLKEQILSELKPEYGKTEKNSDFTDTQSKINSINTEKHDKISLHETERFLKILRKRATTSPSHELYLQSGADSGNNWAKLEIAATWLSNKEGDKNHSEQAMKYLNELANSNQSYLGAEAEASYFLGEIYRIGMRNIRPNEDLSFKYFIRASALGHKPAQHSLAALLVRSSRKGTENPIVLSLLDAALSNHESAQALLQLIEFDWSITYIESVSLVLRTLVDQGNRRAAGFLGRMFLERNNFETAVQILKLADTINNTTIDKIVNIIRTACTTEENINAFVGIIQKHANLNNSYANYQMAIAFSEGVGVPQDKLMAFVYITMASARVFGQERDKLVKLRDELRHSLTDEEIITAQKIIRKNYEI